MIANTCILIVEQGLGKSGPLWFNIAQVAGLALGMVFRFTTYKRFVFLSPERAAARSLQPGRVTDGRFVIGAAIGGAPRAVAGPWPA